jgi:geranylgeranyl diphosphate synthase type II
MMNKGMLRPQNYINANGHTTNAQTNGSTTGTKNSHTMNAQTYFLQEYNAYKQAVERTLETLIAEERPRSLYAPMRYVLAGGGKRIRPVLTMMSCAAVGGNPYDALLGGLAVEILHNFTLVHDDIMDKADMRRSRQTVHKKWNESAAILAGDGMMAIAYQTMMRSPNLERLHELVQALTTGIIEVCEGQAFDLEFQDQDDVSLDEYLLMIEKKTAKMLELAVKIGALVGNGTNAEIEALKQYALALGKAFQIQDDLLDATAETIEFGKTIGGDIIEGKKTYLILRAVEKREMLASAERDLLDRFFRERGLPKDDVAEMQALFWRNGIVEDARAAVEALTNEAHHELQILSHADGRALLAQFSMMLLERKH